MENYTKDSGLNSKKSTEDVLYSRPSYAELATRKAEEAAARRFQAASWLREMYPQAANILPMEPSDEEFRHALRNGIILCNAINRVNPGAVPKIIENTGPISALDGGTFSAIQYFENVRNFLVAVEDMELPTFEASYLEHGGSTTKVVDCVLGLRTYYYWKQTGIGFLRHGINIRFHDGIRLPMGRTGKNSDQLKQKDFFGNIDVSTLLDFLCMKSPEAKNKDQSNSNGTYPSPKVLTRLLLAYLSEKKDEDTPMFLETMVRRMIEEYGQRIFKQHEQLTSFLNDLLQDDDYISLKEEVLRELTKIHHPKDDSQDDNRSEFASEQSCVISKTISDSHSSIIDSDFECYGSLEPKDKLQYLQQTKFQELKNTVRSTRKGVEIFQQEWNDQLEHLGNQIQGLAKAASGYHMVLEENRKLYNQVQDLKGSIRVFCRVRPFLPGQNDFQTSVDYIGENGSLMIVNPSKEGKESRKAFTFNKVYGSSATQEEVFTDTQPLIRSVLDGFNVCIFAYGQTGSGKTYTMSGPNVITKDNWGVNYRALNDLFEISRTREDVMSYQVNVQMVEIYNEQVRDLLVIEGSNKRLEIRNNSQQNGLNVPDANLVPVTCTADVINVMNVGMRNRAVGSTALNDRSSRSHSVLTVHVQGTELTTGSVLRGCLHLVDLAGSERVDKSEATGERLREAQHINRSLSALGDVIAALAQKSQHIPYRNSKLTQLLQESLGGQAKALMFVHISPELEAYGETLSTLKFAERVASVELGTARSNKESGEVRELKEQINTLKVALARKEGESEQLPSMKTSKVIAERPTRGVSPMRSQKQSKDLQVTPNGRQTTQEARSISTGRHIKPTLARDIVVDDDTFSNSPRLLRRPSPDKRSASIERKTVPTERRSVSVDRRNQTRSRIKADMLEATEERKFQDKISVNRSIAIQNVVSRDEASVRPLVASDLAKHDSITDMFYQRRNNNAMKVYPEREDKQFLGDTIERNGVIRCKPEQIGRLDNMVKGTTEGSSTTTDDSSEVDLFRTSDVSDSELLHFKELNFVEAAPAPNIPRQKKLQYPSSRTSQQPDRRSPMKARSPGSANRMITSMQSKSMAVRQSTASLQPSRTEMKRPSPGPKGQARFL